MTVDPTCHRWRDLPRLRVTRKQVRGATWSSPTTGVHVRREQLGSLRDDCLAIQEALPTHAVFTHLTAASLRGWWLPVGVRQVPVVVSTDVDAVHHDRRGVYVRRCDVPAGHRHELQGLRIASPAWTIAELAEHLSLIDLTAVIDCARHRGEVTLPELWGVCVKGRRGVRTLRRAIRLSDDRSESYWETVMRLLHVLCDLDRVRPQFQILDDEGCFVARADLWLEGTRRVHEVDGGHHLSEKQQEDDLDRGRRLARSGWVRHGYTARTLTQDPAQVVRDAEDAFGLRRDPSRVAAWWFEARQASITVDGRRRLRGRLHRFDRRRSPRSRHRDRRNIAR